MSNESSLKASIRKINDNAVTISTPHTVFRILNFGARMSLINFDGNVIVYSPMKYDQEVFDKAIKVLFENQENPQYEVKYVIAANDEHNLWAHVYKEKFGSKIIAGENCKLKNNCKADHVVTSKIYNKVIKGSMWQDELNVSDPFMQSLELIGLGNHVIHDLELFDTTSKTLYVGDSIYNLGVPGTTSGNVILEQYSPELGYAKGYNPHGWFSFLTRYLQPDSIICRYLANYAAGTKTKEGKEAIQTVYNWDFDKLVMIHGNVIEKDGKDAWKKLFASSLV